MKKLLTLGLALVMVVLAIASCNPGEGEASSTPNQPIPTPPPTSSTPESTPEDTPPETPSDTDPIVEEIVFENCDEAVYVVNTEFGLKLRTSTSFDGEANVADIVDPGTELRRIGVHKDWSKVVFENKEYFTSTKYLSTEKPSESDEEIDGKYVFEDVDEIVIVNTGYEDGQVNIYSKPSKNAPITDMALPTEGTELKRTGIAYDTEDDPEGLGWSRVIYNEKECYIRNSMLKKKVTEAA